MMTTIKPMVSSESSANTRNTVKPIVNVVSSRQSRCRGFAGGMETMHERIRKSVDDALCGIASGRR